MGGFVQGLALARFLSLNRPGVRCNERVSHAALAGEPRRLGMAGTGRGSRGSSAAALLGAGAPVPAGAGRCVLVTLAGPLPRDPDAAPAAPRNAAERPCRSLLRTRPAAAGRARRRSRRTPGAQPALARAGAGSTAAARPLPALVPVSSDSGGSSIDRATFASPALAGAGSFFVYLPPGYASTTRRYPVLYLLHGRQGHAQAFLEIGTPAGARPPDRAQGDPPDDRGDDSGPDHPRKLEGRGAEAQREIRDRSPGIGRSHASYPRQPRWTRDRRQLDGRLRRHARRAGQPVHASRWSRAGLASSTTWTANCAPTGRSWRDSACTHFSMALRRTPLPNRRRTRRSPPSCARPARKRRARSIPAGTASENQGAPRSDAAVGGALARCRTAPRGRRSRVVSHNMASHESK